MSKGWETWGGDNRPGQERWAEMLPRLKELCDLEHSASEIADILNDEYGTNLTRNAVIGKRQRMFGRRVPVVNLMRKKAPPRPMAELLVEPPLRGVHILNLGPHHCRWIEGPASSLIYCGEITDGLSSWCPQHVKVVYGKSNVRS